MAYVRKSCGRCGHTARVSHRILRCKQPSPMGRMGYLCWGRLIRVPSVVEMIPAQAPKNTPQQRAAIRADLAQKKFDETLGSILRAVTSLKRWQAKAKHWSRRASMTDQQIHAEIERRKERQIPGKRGIAKGGL